MLRTSISQLASYWYIEKEEMKITPSTPTESIAATISSPVTWTWEPIIYFGRFLNRFKICVKNKALEWAKPVTILHKNFASRQP